MFKFMFFFISPDFLVRQRPLITKVNKGQIDSLKIVGNQCHEMIEVQKWIASQKTIETRTAA